MFNKKWKKPSEIFIRMTQLSIAAGIIIGLCASIIYHNEVYSAANSKKENSALVHEALAAASETQKAEESAEPDTESASVPETVSETVSETTAEVKVVPLSDSDLLAKGSETQGSTISSLFISNELFLSILQLQPNYLADILSLRESWNSLESNLTQMLESYSGDWSVYVKDLKTGDTISLNEHSMESASLIKLYIMGAVMEQIYNGNLEETSRITSLLEDMITVSDNEASNELVRYLSDSHNHKEGMAVVNDFIARHGYKDTEQINGLADTSLWSGNGVNTTSAQDCGKLMESIYNGELVSHMASRRMESLLLGQKITYKIPEALPEGAQSASKTGEVSGVENDTAIIYSRGGDFILCIMSAEWNSQNSAVNNIHEITETVYQYFNS